MTLVFSSNADFENQVDGLETVDLYYMTNGVLAETPVTIAHAWRKNMSLREAAASNGLYVQTDYTFRWPTSEASQPNPGSRIGDIDGYVVMESQSILRLGRVRIVARDLAIFGGLDSYCTILKANTERGNSGASKPIYTVWKSGVRVRIQSDGVTSQVVDGRHAARETANAYFAIQEKLDKRFRIRASDGGADWRVTGYNGPDQIGQLAIVELERDL